MDGCFFSRKITNIKVHDLYNLLCMSLYQNKSYSCMYYANLILDGLKTEVIHFEKFDRPDKIVETIF